MRATVFSLKKGRQAGLGILLLIAFVAVFPGNDLALGQVLIDSNESEVTVPGVPGELVDLKLKSEVGQKVWVILEPRTVFPGLQFARPNDAYVSQHQGYVFVFSQNGQFFPDAANLYYLESADTPRIDFGLNDVAGVGDLVIYTKKGAQPDNLETIQTVTLLEPGSPGFYNYLMEDIEDLFGDAKDIDIDNPFDDLF